MAHTAQQSSVAILRQLYFLRNITITFIAVMALMAFFGLGIQLPVIPLSIILLIMAITNLITRLIIDSRRAPDQQVIFIQLLVEILSFSLILYYSGGATNPFTFFYLIPLAIAATIIPGRLTWFLTLLTLGIYTLLLEFYLPLSYEAHDHQAMGSSSQFNQHVIGMWFGFMVSAMLVTWFITYLSKELKQRDQAINEARQREIRDQQMVTLGALAAGTAHELGTPLASLAIITDDLTDGFEAQQYPELFENQKILRQQIQRCKEILSVLSETAGESRADEGYLISARVFIQRLLDDWSKQTSSCNYRLGISDAISDDEQLLYDTTLQQALTNLLNNAHEASSEPLQIEVERDHRILTLRIIDHGPGLTPQQQALAGEVGFTSKPDGMGIGLFLAINTIRRSGGDIEFKPGAEVGTVTEVTLPLTNNTHDE